MMFEKTTTLQQVLIKMMKQKIDSNLMRPDKRTITL